MAPERLEEEASGYWNRVAGQNTKRESGHKVQLGNINAAKTIADVIRTSLGPRAMLKMLMDPMGGVVMTNDGNAILREIQVSFLPLPSFLPTCSVCLQVQHPAAKSMIEISRTQDEEVGDGTTSVIVLGTASSGLSFWVQGKGRSGGLCSGGGAGGGGAVPGAEAPPHRHHPGLPHGPR